METNSSVIVWAKLKYEPFWPARITDPPPELPKVPPRRFCVYFFGTNNYGYPLIENVKSFHQNREKYLTKGRGDKFKHAIRECDDFLKDPNNFCTIQPDEIVVKEEHGYYIKDEDMSAQPIKKVFKHSISCPECIKIDEQIKSLDSQIQKLSSEVLAAETKNLSGNEYEVKSILNHKIEQRRLYFLVHWKGYGKHKSTWEPKENLNCDLILNEYLKANNLN